MYTTEEARQRLLREPAARAVLKSLIYEYDRAARLLAEFETRGLQHSVTRTEGELAGLRAGIAVFTGAYALPVGSEMKGVEGWMPVLRQIAS